MTLVELLIEEGIELPDFTQGGTKPEKTAFMQWLAKQVEIEIKKKGAFFLGYELKVLQSYATKQGKGIFNSHTYFKANSNIKPRFTAPRMQRYKGQTLIKLLRDIKKAPISLIPSSIRQTHIWYVQEAKALKFVNTLVDWKEGRDTKKTPVYTATLKDVYVNAFITEGQRGDSFTNPHDVGSLRADRLTGE